VYDGEAKAGACDERKELLVAGRSVKTVAAEVGYRQPSAFVEFFRQTLGMTPKTWVTGLEAQDKRTRPK
jgi:AraC-like DNA-binding protein